MVRSLMDEDVILHLRTFTNLELDKQEASVTKVEKNNLYLKHWQVYSLEGFVSESTEFFLYLLDKC